MDIKLSRFIEHPEESTLFRGERQNTRGGLHFTTNPDWARNFGTEIVEIRLPTKSKIKLLTLDDLQEGYERGFMSEKLLWDFIFSQGYDAIVGYDTMRITELDVIVNPKHISSSAVQQ